MSPVVEFRSEQEKARVASNGKRWVEVLSHTDPKYGGLSSAVPALARRLSERSGWRVSLAAFCLPGEEYEPTGLSRDGLSFWPAGRLAWLKSPLFRQSSNALFTDLLRRGDGVHIHGLWEASTMLAASTAREVRMPYILSAHGMLEPWALRAGRAKKALYSALIERANVRGAACLHALTLAEAKQFIAFGARSPIAVIPNGVQVPERPDASLFFTRFPELHRKRLVLYLARLHRKKGPNLLIEAWSEVARHYPDAHLVLAGPDSEGTQVELQRLIEERDLGDSITFTGMLRDDAKWSALAAAECFVLPSFSEGLSVAVLEAMALGLPVIVTDACNMPEVEQAGAGWQVRPRAAELARALLELLAHSAEENNIIGGRAVQLVQSRYTWATVADQMSELYEWVLGGRMPTTFPMIQP